MANGNNNVNWPDIWIKQFEIAWNNFERRRSYEWKVNLAFWGAIGALSLFLLKEDFYKVSGRSFVILLLAAVIALIVHSFFLYSITRKHAIDKEIDYFYIYRIILVIIENRCKILCLQLVHNHFLGIFELALVTARQSN